MAVLVIAEHDNQNLKASTLNTITAALQLKLPVTVLVVGYLCSRAAEQAAEIQRVNAVISVDDVVYQHQLAENIAKLIVELAGDYTHLFAPATTYGKDIMPRVAALLDVGQISDIYDVINAETYRRPIYAGNALATVQSSDPIKIITVRTTRFPEAGRGDKAAPVKSLSIVFPNEQTEFVGCQPTVSERPELTHARVVIGGGRGLQNAENFKLLEPLAKLLNAAIGASRAVVDEGFVPNDYQIGQTGKVIAPDLYIAVGISGAIQHIAGIKDSKVIVAINSDPNAPIFAVADYGIVGDLFVVLPELEAEIVKVIGK